MFHFLYDLRDIGCDYAELYDLVIPRLRFVLSQLKERFCNKIYNKNFVQILLLKIVFFKTEKSEKVNFMQEYFS